MQGQLAMQKLQLSLADYPLVSMQLFSAFRKIGLQELREKLLHWFALPTNSEQ